MKNHRIFISHAWERDTYLNQLHHLLTKAGYFCYDAKNIIQNTPVRSRNIAYVKARLAERIFASDVMLVPASTSMPSNYWLKWEMTAAKHHRVAIIGIMQTQKRCSMSSVTSFAKEIISWNKTEILETIAEYKKQPIHV